MTRLYRVSDDDAQAQRVDGQGIKTSGVLRDKIPHFHNWRWDLDWAREMNGQFLVDHMEWHCRDPSPFISASRYHDWAFQEACRRVAQGRTNVVIYHIETEVDGERIQFRSAERLAKNLDVYDLLSDAAKGLAKHECLFVHEIPEEAIVDTEPVDVSDTL